MNVRLNFNTVVDTALCRGTNEQSKLYILLDIYGNGIEVQLKLPNVCLYTTIN